MEFIVIDFHIIFQLPSFRYKNTLYMPKKSSFLESKYSDGIIIGTIALMDWLCVQREKCDEFA